MTIAADEPNQLRLAAALEALRARAYLAGERGTAYHTDLGQLEVMRRTDGVGDYEAWARDASVVEIEPGLAVEVGSASHLLLAKEQAGRTKDIEALPLIRAELIAHGTLDVADVRGPVAEPAREFEPDPRAEELLGPRPRARRARGLWDHAAALVADYRERWRVPDDDGPLLGSAPLAGSDQALDRAALDRQLERLLRLLDRAPG